WAGHGTSIKRTDKKGKTGRLRHSVSREVRGHVQTDRRHRQNSPARAQHSGSRREMSPGFSPLAPLEVVPVVLLGEEAAPPAERPAARPARSAGPDRKSAVQAATGR